MITDQLEIISSISCIYFIVQTPVHMKGVEHFQYLLGDRTNGWGKYFNFLFFRCGGLGRAWGRSWGRLRGKF